MSQRSGSDRACFNLQPQCSDLRQEGFISRGEPSRLTWELSLIKPRCSCLRLENLSSKLKYSKFFLDLSIFEVKRSCFKLENLTSIETTGLTIRGRAGLWAKYFLNRQGKAEGRAFYQYGVLSKKLLQAIIRVWQHNQGAARMLAWLAFRTRVGKGQPLIATTLMEVTYGIDKVTAAYYDPKLRAKLADTWDNDLLVLSDEGWEIEFDLTTYPSEIQPCWQEGGRGSNRRPKGFWDRLRGGWMWVYPPKEIAEGVAELEKRKTLSKPKSK